MLVTEFPSFLCRALSTSPPPLRGHGGSPRDALARNKRATSIAVRAIQPGLRRQGGGLMTTECWGGGGEEEGGGWGGGHSGNYGTPGPCLA